MLDPEDSDIVYLYLEIPGSQTSVVTRSEGTAVKGLPSACSAHSRCRSAAPAPGLRSFGMGDVPLNTEESLFAESLICCGLAAELLVDFRRCMMSSTAELMTAAGGALEQKPLPMDALMATLASLSHGGSTEWGDAGGTTEEKQQHGTMLARLALLCAMCRDDFDAAPSLAALESSGPPNEKLKQCAPQARYCRLGHAPPVKKTKTNRWKHPHHKNSYNTRFSHLQACILLSNVRFMLMVEHHLTANPQTPTHPL